MVGRLVITSVETCFRHQRLEQHPPPHHHGRFRKRKQALRRLPLVWIEGDSSGQSQHIFPKSLSPGFQMRAMGCHWEKQVVRNMRTCPCPHCSRAIAGKVDWAKPIPLWRRHSIIPEGEAEKNTPQDKVVTTCSPSLIPFTHFFP